MAGIEIATGELFNINIEKFFYINVYKNKNGKISLGGWYHEKSAKKASGEGDFFKTIVVDISD